MIRLVTMATLCLLALLATGTGLIRVIDWTIERRIMGLLEYPEKDLISICLSSATSLVASRAIDSEHVFFRILRPLTFWISIVVGLGAMCSKAALSMISADGDIHQWHLICVWSGGLLLALAGSGRLFGAKLRSDATLDFTSGETP